MPARLALPTSRARAGPGRSQRSARATKSISSALLVECRFAGALGMAPGFLALLLGQLRLAALFCAQLGPLLLLPHRELAGSMWRHPMRRCLVRLARFGHVRALILRPGAHA